MKHVRLQDKAYTWIRKLIVGGTLTRAEFVTEGQLVEQLGMSRTPVRAALHRLEQEGFVQIFPKQGVYIPELSVAQIHEMYDLRIALETFAVRRLTVASAERNFEALCRLLELQHEQLEHANSEAFMRHDTQFHVALIKMLDNQELATVFERNSDKLLMFGREIFKRDMKRLELSYQEHSAIVAAMENGDVDEAVRNMEEHLLRGRAVLLNDNPLGVS